ncbi:MAG: thioredoxin family protein [Helicobacter sp.]|nr:thioredoxin family protein [Helicobacter sp.]
MTKLTQQTYEDSIKEGISLVTIGAPWCPDCRKIEPILEILAKEYGKQVNFFTVRADEEENLKESLGVKRIPTLIFYKNGVEVGERVVEPDSKNTIEGAIKQILNA